MIYDPLAKPRGAKWRQPLQHDYNEHDRRIRREPRPEPTPGAHGSSDSAESLSATSARDGTTIHEQRVQDRAVEEFVNSLTGEERAFAERNSVAKPLADPFPRRGRDVADPDQEESEPPHADSGGKLNGRPLLHRENIVLDHIEPERASAIGELTEGDILEAHDAFGRAIAWVHEARLLMKKAHRLAALISLCRPDLAESLPSEPSLRTELYHRLDFEPSQLALVFGRVFAWSRDVATLSGLGIRADIIAYVVRPQLLDAATNARIGAQLGNTRAAINKLVQEFRDTFAGFRARAMRGESTRRACRSAQLA